MSNGAVICIAYLTKYLAFTKDKALKTGGHSEQMANGSFIVVANEMRSEYFRFNSMKRGEKVSERISLGDLVELSRNVKFNPVAR